MDCRYSVPGRAFISKELEAIYIELRAKITSFLQQANKVSICADIWSKKGMTSSYLGITGAFFSQKDNHRHCVVTLAVRQMPPSHRVISICYVFQEVLSEWEIPSNKVLAVVTDNGSNIVAAFKSHFRVVGDDRSSDDSIDIQDEDRGDIQDEHRGDNKDEDRGDIQDESRRASDEVDFDKLEQEHEEAFSSFGRISCFSHTQELVVHKFDSIPTCMD